MSEYFAEYWQTETKLENDTIEFKNIINSDKMPYLKDHFFAGQCLLPGAVMADMMATACSMVDRQIDIFPLTVKKLRIHRGIQVDAGADYPVTIRAKLLEKTPGGTLFTAEVLGIKTNKAGKVVRTNVLVADGEFVLGDKEQKIAPPDFPLIETFQYECEKQDFYKENISSHGPLMKTLTGDISYDAEKWYISGGFEIEEKENDFSTKKGLPFMISPRGFDSVLQLSVFLGILIAPGDSENLYSKLPIGIDNFVLKEPFKESSTYTVHLKASVNNEEGLELKAGIAAEDGTIWSTTERITLKKAPYELWVRGSAINYLSNNKAKSCT